MRKPRILKTLAAALDYLFFVEAEIKWTKASHVSMSVSYTKEMEEVNILPDRDQSVPPNGVVTSDSFLRHFYPSLPRVAK